MFLSPANGNNMGSALNIVDNNKQETGKDVVATALSLDFVKFCPPIWWRQQGGCYSALTSNGCFHVCYCRQHTLFLVLYWLWLRISWLGLNKEDGFRKAKNICGKTVKSTRKKWFLDFKKLLFSEQNIELSMQQDIEWHNASSMCDTIFPHPWWRAALLDIWAWKKDPNRYVPKS